MFAGLLTKVGVYAIVRTQTKLFPRHRPDVAPWIAALTMVVGVLGAIAQNEIKRILSFHIVSQIGYMVFGIAIGGVAAIAATIFFLIHQIPMKTSLFLVDGMVEHSSGTSRLDRLSGLAHRSGFLALLFLLPALSLSGIPPFSGFVAKLGLVTAGFDAGRGGRRRDGARVQPADARVDDEDLGVGVLGRAGALASPRRRPLRRRRGRPGRPRRRRRDPAERAPAVAGTDGARHGRTRRGRSRGRALGGPALRRCASGRPPTSSRRHATRRGWAPMKRGSSHALPLFVVLVGDLAAAPGRADGRERRRWCGARRRPDRALPGQRTVVHHRLHPWAFFKFMVFVLYSLVMSSWEVIKVIVRPDTDVIAVGHRPGPARGGVAADDDDRGQRGDAHARAR